MSKWDGRSSTLQNEQHLGVAGFAAAQAAKRKPTKINVGARFKPGTSLEWIMQDGTPAKPSMIGAEFQREPDGSLTIELGSRKEGAELTLTPADWEALKELMA